MRSKYDWLNKKTWRSVDQLRLWSDNPRLNPDETHVTLSDFAEDLTSDNADKLDFYMLVNSIVEDGFVPADPMVVWKDESNQKYYVAEGNRRLVALKLLREPNKAPKSIRSFIRRASDKINITTIDKIPVSIAPSFEEAEWYINQRNSASSLQRRWSSEQQRRWIYSLYEKYNGDMDKLLSITKLQPSDLENIIRILKIRDYVKLDEVKALLTEDEFAKANSYRFPITVLERFFNYIDVRQEWGLEFSGVDVNIISNRASFFAAYADLIKRIVSNNDDKINTRLNKENLREVLDSLPKVDFSPNPEELVVPADGTSEGSGQDSDGNDAKGSKQSATNQYLKGNPNRPKMILPIYELHTSSYRLLGIFDELKRLSLSYKNIAAASLRVFLDLSVLNYIETEGIANDIKTQCKTDLVNIPLKRRLEYLKTNKLSGKPQNIVAKLIDPSHTYSLDILNGFIHGQDTHYLNKEFLNGFWDFLFPLFQIMLDIREIDE